ncbi:alpha/beta fold hydrolase [Paenibacillus marinisediminis]
MRFESKYVNNNGVSIHYLDSATYADPALVPLIICPGLSETAEEYVDVLEYLLPRRCVVLSFRGRGNSSTPLRGYDLEEHITDIECVRSDIGIEQFHLLGYSRGASYALGFAHKHADSIRSLLLEDYPAEHKQMPLEWADEYILDYLIPFHREHHIREDAVRGIQADSTQIDLARKLELPVLIMRGLLPGSLISDADLCQYRNMIQHLTVQEFAHSGHNIRGTEKSLLFTTIYQYLAQHE